MDFNNYNQPMAYGAQSASVSRVSAVLRRVYLLMTGGLLVTAVTALACASSQGFINLFMSNGWMMWALILVEFALVLGISGALNKLTSTAAALLFIAFAIVNGMTFWTLLYAFTSSSIAKTFFIAAGTFGAMAVYGLCTNRDLTRWGNLLIMALFGLIIATLVNLFFKSQGFDTIISFVGVLIFVGLTAWDNQQIKRMAMMAPEDTVWKLAVLGALNLYLDFINMFLYLLRFFGDSRD